MITATKTRLCPTCTRAGVLRFRPCRDHATPVNPATCNHDFRPVIVAHTRPGSYANGLRDCKAAICLDCFASTDCECGN